MANKHINIGVGLTFDKNSLNMLKNELQTIQKMSLKEFVAINKDAHLENAQRQLRDLKTSAELVRNALTNAFNVDLGTVNITKLRSELDKIDVARVYKNFQNAGAAGVSAFNSLSSATLKANLQLKESHTLLNKMAETMGNTVKWGITSSIFNNLTGSVQKAWNYTKELDSSLNDIRIVTNKSANEMERFAQNANKAARNLGKTTKDFADASLIYYQQGYDDTESQKRAEITLKTANVTGQSTAEVSEQLTAVWNGYKVELAETEKYVDKLAAVAATTASDLEELSTGMSKVASAASLMGVDIDQLSATLATVISVTRQAPESVGTAFKTIYARMGDIKAGIDSETSLDSYTQDMLDIGGINVLDANKELRDMGEVIEEVGNKWSSMTREQQVALSQVMAGTRQYNNLLSLFDNWDMYTDAIATSRGSLGTLQAQQDIYMESTEAHLEQLSAAWERVWNSAIDTKATNGLIDILTGLTNGFANLIESIGGGGNALIAIGGIATRVFHKQIASGISTSIKNFQAAKYNAQQLQEQLEVLEKLRKDAPEDRGTQVRYEAKQQMEGYIGNLSNEQILEYNKIIDDYGTAVAKEEEYSKRRVQAQEFVTRTLGKRDSITNIEAVMRGDFTSPIGEQFSENIDKTKNDIEIIQNQIEEFTKAYERYKESVAVQWVDLETNKPKDPIKSVREINNSGDAGLQTDYRKVDVTFKNIKKTIKSLTADTSGLSQATKDYLEKALAKYDSIDTKSQAWLNGTAELEKRLEAIGSEAKKAFDTYVQEADEAIKVLDEEAEHSGKAEQAYREAAEEKRKLWEQKNTEGIQIVNLTSVVDTISAVQTLTSAILTLQNIGNIWNDETLSSGEKFLQILMALTSAATMGIMGMTNLVQGIHVLTTSIIGSAKAYGMEALTLKIRNQLIAEGVALEQAEIISKNLAKKATQNSTKAIWGEVAAMVAKKALMAGALLLAIGAVVAITYGLVKAYNADAEAATRANEAAEKLNERYIELKTAAEDFKAVISEYNDGVKALDELEKHTEEYKKTLEETNEKAKELIETYGLWNDYDIKNGIISIDPDALKEAQDKADLKVVDAETTAYGANIAAGQANLKLARTEFAREIGALQKAEYFTKGAGGITRYVEGTTYEAGERMTETNQLSDASIQQIVTELNKIRETDIAKYEMIIANGNEAVLKDTILSIDGLAKATKENIDQVLKHKDALIKLTEETYKQADAASYYTSQIMQNEVEKQYGAQLKAMATDADGNVDQGRYNQLLAITASNKKQQEDMENDLKNLDLSKKYTSNNALNDNYGYSIKNDEDLARTYAKEVLGYTQEEIDKMDYDGHTGAGTLKIANGDKVLDKYSDEQMREQLARQKRTNEIKEKYAGQINEQDQINALGKLMDGAKTAGQKYGTDFTDALLNSLTDENHVIDFSSLFAEIDPSEYAELTAMSDQEILDMIGMDEEVLKNAGYTSAEEFITNFKAGLNNYEWDVDTALTAAVGKRDDNYEEMDLDTEDVKDYAKHLMEVSGASEELADSMETSADAGALVAEYVIRMNKGIEALAENIDDWTDVLKKSSQESEEYSDAMDGIQDSLSDVLGVESDFISNSYVTDHLKDIEKAAEGDEAAIDRLKDALAEDIILKVMAEGEVDINTQYNILNKIEELQNQIPNIKVGTEIEMDDETYAQFFQDMQNIVAQAGLTAEQANALFSTMGFEAEFATESQPVKKTGRGTRTVTEFMDETTVTMPDGSTMNIPSGWETKTYPGEPYEYVDYVDAIAMSTDGKTPKINKLTKKGSSSMNNYSSSNKGGGSAKKGGGGGKKANTMDKVDKTPDRYHKVDTQLSKIGNQLSKIQSQEKKLTGAELIANINAQLGQLDNRLDQLREKVKIAQGEAGELRDSLANQGVKFNDDGTIANYMEIYNAKVAYVNDLIEKYNGMSAEEQEAYKETVEQAKEDLDKFTEDLDRYDELVSDFIPGLNNEIQDAIDEEIELNIKKFNLEFDIRLNLKDAQKDWNEFKKRILDGIDEDDIYGNAKARVEDDFTNMIGPNGVQNSTKRAQRILEELREMDETGWSDVYGDNRAQALEELKAAYEEINEDLMEIDQIQKDVYQAWLDTMDEINEKMADQVAMYEQISNIIDHDMKVIELVYGEQDYEAMGKYYEQQHKNNLGLLDFQRQNVAFWEQEMNSIDKEKDPDAWKKARDNWISAVNDVNATVEDSIQNARDKMENAIDDVFNKFNNEITDGKGLDYLQQQWDLVNDVADDYLDTVNAAFGIRQLESKYQDAIDATDNVGAQRKLNELMEKELKSLREKDKLTEYDVERANMKYEIALKQIALEEAQQSKTTMRLRRDSQGNYRYEYIADQEALDKLQDELDVLENSLYNFDKERWIEMQNQVVDAVQERQDAIKEIMMDASLSEDERLERLTEINRLYNEKIKNITEQTVAAQTNLYESGNNELLKLQLEQQVTVDEMLDQFNTGVNGMIEKFSGPGGFEDLTTQSFDNLKIVAQQYKTDLESIETAADVSFSTVRDGIDDTIPKTQNLVEDNKKLNDEYTTQITNIKNLNTQLGIQADKYKKIAEEAKNATQEAKNYWTQQQEQDADDAGKGNTGGNDNGGNKGNDNKDNDNKNNNPGSGSGNNIPEIGDYVIYSGGPYYEQASGKGKHGERGAGKKVKITAISNGSAYPIHVVSNDSAYGWLTKNQLKGYDTGGYTGDWAGGYGKLAMLHSKELVLNAHDTENMLSMMQIARDVIALAGPRVGALSAGKGAGAAAGQLEQNVHIEANFPNVESALEIEEALNNLVQLASQRANRNTRG